MEIRDTKVEVNISDLTQKFEELFYNNAEYILPCGVEDHIIEGLAEVYTAETYIPKISRHDVRGVNRDIMEIEFGVDYRRAFNNLYGHVAFCPACFDRFKNESNKALSELVSGDYKL